MPKGSWRTTTLGILGALALLITQGQAFLDDDPETHVQIEAIAAALAVFGIGVQARDNKVKSESVGAS